MVMKCGSYDEKNLLRYDEVIRLVFDKERKRAWFELKNYEDVLAVGPQGSNSHPPSPDRIVSRPIVAGRWKDGVEPDPKHVNIGLLLDAVDVIRFQRAVLRLSTAAPDSPYRELLGAGLTAVGAAVTDIITDEVLFERDFPWGIYGRIVSVLRNKAEEADRVGPGYAGVRQYYQCLKLGFIGYFPKPSLIGEEERTQLGTSGKTAHEDIRKLEDVPASGPVPPKGAADLYIDGLDDALERGLLRSEKKQLLPKLHKSLPRVCCYAFRGDDRDPLELSEVNGFLPGVTRTDAGAMKKSFAYFVDDTLKYREVAEVAETLDRTLDMARKPAKRGKAQAADDDIGTYLGALRLFNMFHLGTYTSAQDFRGYVSTTKSVAIAKHFANAWKKSPVCRTWCYAVRCHGGYELPSCPSGLQDPNTFTPNNLKDIHKFAAFAEQEVAVAGAIWWDHFVGFRSLKCDTNGQFFAGPVYLREEGYWKHRNDTSAFNCLFEIMSGRSQGSGRGIFKSYEAGADPWAFKPNTADRPAS